MADALVEAIQASFEGACDPSRAAPMAAYMRDRFPFLGIPTPRRRALAKAVCRDFDPPAERLLAARIDALWKLPEREYQYFATDYAIASSGGLSAKFLGRTRKWITTRSWWDTVDALASHLVAGLVRGHPELQKTMDAWIADDDLWLARTALLHQLRYKQQTDPDRLFRYCAALGSSEEFFLRKAIGWALREYSKTAPDAVEAFLAAHGDGLSPLSRREARKWLDRRPRS